MLRWISRGLNRCSLRLRLILFILLPLIGATFLAGYSVLSHLERQGEQRMQQDVELIARVLRDPLAHALERNRAGSIRQTMQSAFRIGRVYGVYLYDDTGRMVATSGAVSPDADLQSSVLRTVESGERVGEYNRMEGRAVYSYFVPLKATGGDTIGLLQITRRGEDFENYMSRLRKQAAAYLLTGAVLMTGIVFAGYHSAAGRSLGRLRRSMNRIEAGEHGHRASRDGPPEISALAGSLNRMVESLVLAQREIELRRAAEEALERELRRSEKLATLGQLAAGVAHELGGPLSLIDGRAQRLLRKAGGRIPGDSLLKSIRQQVQRMERLIRQLLEFGRPSSSHRKRVGAELLAGMAVRTHTDESAAAEAAVELRGPKPGPEVLVDPFRVELALKNLLTNARQATPRGRVLLSWRRCRSSVEFRVADDGPGVPADVEGAIFDPFFSTKQNSEGSGLGLSVVQQVADEHGAHLNVGRSAMGGAEFCLSFPVAPGVGTPRVTTRAPA